MEDTSHLAKPDNDLCPERIKVPFRDALRSKVPFPCPALRLPPYDQSGNRVVSGKVQV
jgi:hypothetical protein